MKIHYLLLTLTASALGLATIEPWLLNSQPNQPSQSVQVVDQVSLPANLQVAQAVAKKVTVRIKVGEGFSSGVLLGQNQIGIPFFTHQYSRTKSFTHFDPDSDLLCHCLSYLEIGWK